MERSVSDYFYFGILGVGWVCLSISGGWGTVGMVGDRARASRDRGSDDADADVGDPRGCRRACWDAAIAGRPAPTPARPALPPGVLCVQSERAIIGSCELLLTGVSSEAILAPLLSVVMLVTGAAAGAAGGSGMDKPATGWSIGGMAGPEEPPKMALIMDGLGTAVVSAGSAMRAPAEVLTPRVAARRALERTMVVSANP